MTDIYWGCPEYSYDINKFFETFLSREIVSISFSLDNFYVDIVLKALSDRILDFRPTGTLNGKYRMMIAAYIRNNVEDFHSKHLNDNQMIELNLLIRNAVYTALLAICQRSAKTIADAEWYIPEYCDTTTNDNHSAFGVSNSSMLYL